MPEEETEARSGPGLRGRAGVRVLGPDRLPAGPALPGRLCRAEGRREAGILTSGRDTRFSGGHGGVAACGEGMRVRTLLWAPSLRARQSDRQEQAEQGRGARAGHQGGKPWVLSTGQPRPRGDLFFPRDSVEASGRQSGSTGPLLGSSAPGPSRPLPLGPSAPTARPPPAVLHLISSEALDSIQF